MTSCAIKIKSFVRTSSGKAFIFRHINHNQLCLIIIYLIIIIHQIKLNESEDNGFATVSPHKI